MGKGSESKKKLRLYLNNSPNLVIFTETGVTDYFWVEWWNSNRFELCNYSGVFLENGNKKRGIIVLCKKPATIENYETINRNILKVTVKTGDEHIAVFATYAPSQGNNVEFFHDLRRSQLDSTEKYQIIAGDLNTTLDPLLDKEGYLQDDHWRSRELINSWCEDESESLIDVYRYCNPGRKQFTWRKKNYRQQARLDYILVSSSLAHAIKNCTIQHCPWDISDHSIVSATIQIEQLETGPGTFRCTYGLNKIPEYRLMIKHHIHETLTDISKMNVVSKAIEHANNRVIYDLSILKGNDTPNEKYDEQLAITLSLQKTKQELIEKGLDISTDYALDYIIQKVASVTKIFQKKYRNQKEDLLNGIQLDLSNAIEEGDVELRGQLDLAYKQVLDTICQEEAKKMQIFRLLHDEKPSKAMIDLEKKMAGYCTITKLNKPNPGYVPPTEGNTLPTNGTTEFTNECFPPTQGGSLPNREALNDHVVNPKSLLMSDPVEIRSYLRHFMQKIYKKQEGLKTSKEDLLDFLSKDSDNAVTAELEKRKLTSNEREELEGPITKEEMTDQLFKHMKPHSAPGIDGFTVDWVKSFWDDLSDLCCNAVNNCYERGQLTTMLKTAIMKLLRKGDKCRLEATNYRPISLLSVFYKIASGVITRRLDKVINKVIGRQQKAYSKVKNITSVLLNIINMIDQAGKTKRSGLLVAIDFKKAFDSINLNFIDSCLETFGFGPSFRKWVKLFFNGRETYLLMNGYMDEKISLEQGVPQGDILSPLIFNIVVEFLLIKICYTKLITGVSLPGGEGRAEAYADDTTIGITRSEKNLRGLVKIISEFGELSGLHANLDKTHVMPIGPNKDKDDIICPDLGLNWTNSFKLLGLDISSDLTLLNMNIEKKILRVESLITTWEKRHLTTTGRVAIAKSILLAQLVYPMQTLDLDDQTLDKIERMLYGYIKGRTKRNWLSKSYICTPTAKGGLGFFNIRDFYLAQKMTLLRRYAKDECNDLWCDVLDKSLGTTKETRHRILEWGDDRAKQFSKLAPRGLKGSFIALAELVQRLPTTHSSRDNSWISQPFFSNSNIKTPSPRLRPRENRVSSINELDCGLPRFTNLKIIDLFENGNIVTRELLEDRLQSQFPGFTLSENTFLRIRWYIPFVGGAGMFHNKTAVIFPLLRMILDEHPPKFSSASLKALTRKITKGSKPYRKVLERRHDFLSEEKLQQWREATKEPTLTMESLRHAFKMISCKYLSANQKENILRLLSRKTLYNNQIEKIYPNGDYPEWFVSKYCQKCAEDGIYEEEDLYHANFSCPKILEFKNAAYQLFGFSPNINPNPIKGPRFYTAPTTRLPAAAGQHQTNYPTLVLLWLIHTVSTKFRTENLSLMNSTSELLNAVRAIADSNPKDHNCEYLGRYIEAAMGRLTRPPESSEQTSHLIE